VTKTYGSGDPLVVTYPTTSPPISSLSVNEQTGIRAFLILWPYVAEVMALSVDIGFDGRLQKLNDRKNKDELICIDLGKGKRTKRRQRHTSMQSNLSFKYCQ
jgi:hypothetical protein